jgi:hypothetical protein
LDIVCYLFFGAWNFLYLKSNIEDNTGKQGLHTALVPLGLTQFLDQFDGNILRSSKKGYPQIGDIFRFNEKRKTSHF